MTSEDSRGDSGRLFCVCIFVCVCLFFSTGSTTTADPTAAASLLVLPTESPAPTDPPVPAEPLVPTELVPSSSVPSTGPVAAFSRFHGDAIRIAMQRLHAQTPRPTYAFKLRPTPSPTRSPQDTVGDHPLLLAFPTVYMCMEATSNTSLRLGGCDRSEPSHLFVHRHVSRYLASVAFADQCVDIADGAAGDATTAQHPFVELILAPCFSHDPAVHEQLDNNQQFIWQAKFHTFQHVKTQMCLSTVSKMPALVPCVAGLRTDAFPV